jgi:tRNA (cytidine/uridine-2'-O-)-methyltransferase
MFNVILYEPEIPPNTGNIIRLCANVGAQLHLIEPLGYVLDDKRLRRAGLDYSEFVNVKVHADYARFLQNEKPQRIYACSTKGKRNYAMPEYAAGDYFLFGPESRGLPPEILSSLDDNVIRIPMRPENRSLNLATAVAIIVFEAWRQHGFASGQ